MNEYQQIMSVESVVPFILGFSAQAAIAGFQLWLALAFIGSGLINLFLKEDIGWLRYLGATTNISPRKKGFMGFTQLVVGTILLLPAFASLHFLITLVAFAIVLFFMLAFIKEPPFDGNYKGKFTRGVFVIFAILGATYTAYDHNDPINNVVTMAKDVSKWRPMEQNWQNEFDVNAPKVGDTAPNFTLLSSDEGKPLQLSDYIGEKPVVLFLGANTCPVFSHGLDDINALQAKYKDKVNFVGVYVSEPHATDEWPLAPNNFMKLITSVSEHPVAIDIKQHTKYEERQWAASRLKAKLVNSEIPLLVDNMDNAVNNTWVGRPARLYLLDKNGTVIYNPGKGPYSFNPNHLDPILEKLVASNAEQNQLLGSN